ncbi:hypothetical protein WJX72_003923 [[Myrmecia] bisecta]|uniref:Acyltransferase n=1 Tax=[Myrmecia] bisecta TaxID=41462 RepID=A0AAW1QQU0_9CHLO
MALPDRVAQKLATIVFVLTFSGGIWCWLLAAYLLFNRLTAVPTLLYLLYIWFGPGVRASHDGSWPTPWRRLLLWKTFADYFPATLIKTCDLDPDRSYLMGFHPHGILSVSAWVGFATEATGFSKQFPGLIMHGLTLKPNFKTPFLREFLLLHGMADCDRKTCVHLLSRGTGSAVLLAIGGASESLHSAPGTFDLVLSRRKGFVRVAMETGASLVPVIAFGEVDLFDTIKPPPSSRIARLQKWVEKTWGVTFPIAHGEGIVAGSGLLPRRKPLHIVVGAPIHLDKYTGDLRSEEAVKLADSYHAQYVAALQAMWNKHKEEYAPHRKQDLRIVE